MHQTLDRPTLSESTQEALRAIFNNFLAPPHAAHRIACRVLFSYGLRGRECCRIGESFFSKLWEGECCPCFGLLSLKLFRRRKCCPFFKSSVLKLLTRGECCPFFKFCSREGLWEGGMLSVFYFSDISFSGKLEKTFLEAVEPPWELWEGSGEGSGRLGCGLLGGRGRKRAHEHQTSFKTMFGDFERPKVSCFTRNSQNVFSKTSCFYVPIWRKIR